MKKNTRLYDATSHDIDPSTSFSNRHIIGKKTGICLNSKHGIELAVIELKKGNQEDQPQLPASSPQQQQPSSSRRQERRELLIQESKSIRTNKYIDFFARRLGSATGVLTMDYAADNVGKLCRLKEVDNNCTIVLPVGPPILPISLDQMKDTMLETNIMVELYKFKVWY